MVAIEIFERLLAALAVREAKVFARVVRPFSGGRAVAVSFKGLNRRGTR